MLGFEWEGFWANGNGLKRGLVESILVAVFTFDGEGIECSSIFLFFR